MKRFMIVLIALFSVWFIATPQAFATDDVNSAIMALKTSDVYVAPGLSGTTTETAASLQQSLQPGDHIVLVMLPKTSSTSAQVASQILGSLKEHTTLGLSLNGQVSAFTNHLPNGVVTDLMSRASSIASSPSETLTTFASITQQYQAAHPETVSSTSSPSHHGGSSMGAWIGGACGLLVVIAILLFLLFRHRESTNSGIASASPSSLRPLLGELQRFAGSIDDRVTADRLRTIVSDTGAFFQRSHLSRSRDTQQEATEFERKFNDAVKMLSTYVDVQNNPRYYDSPHDLLQSGQAAIEGLAESVLKSVKRGNTTSLLDYKVNTDILNAARYR